MADRWSDEKLEQFYGEFKEHMRLEEQEQRQNQEIHDAVFQKVDPDTNTPPGLLQLTAQISRQLHEMRADTFLGPLITSQKSLRDTTTSAHQCQSPASNLRRKVSEKSSAAKTQKQPI